MRSTYQSLVEMQGLKCEPLETPPGAPSEESGFAMSVAGSSADAQGVKLASGSTFHTEFVGRRATLLGFVRAETAGYYRFRVVAGGDSCMRIAGQSVIDPGTIPGLVEGKQRGFESRSVYLGEGIHSFVIRYAGADEAGALEVYCVTPETEQLAARAPARGEQVIIPLLHGYRFVPAEYVLQPALTTHNDPN